MEQIDSAATRKHPTESQFVETEVRKQEQEEDELSLPELWRICQLRRWIILGLTVAGFFAALLLSLWMTPKYESRALLEVNKENSDTLGLDSLESMGGGGSDSLDYNVTLQTQATALKSDSLLFQVTDQLGLEKRKEFAIKPGWSNAEQVAAEKKLPLEKSPLRRERIHKAFEKNLQVKPMGGTRIIEVSFRSPDPQVAANVVNSLTSDFLEQYFRTRYMATAQASEWLSKQLNDLKSQVDDSQTRLNELQKEAGILGVVLPGKNGDLGQGTLTSWPAMDKLTELNRQVAAAQADRIVKETIYHLAKSGNPELVFGLANSSSVGGSMVNASSMAVLQNLRTQQAQLHTQYAQASAKYGQHYPEVQELHSQMASLERSIQAENQRLTARAESDYLAAKRSEDEIHASYEQQKSLADKMQNKAIEYAVTERELESGRTVYDSLLAKLKEGGVLAGLRSTNIIILDPARVSARPVRPVYPLNLAVGTAVGLLGGIILAFVRESFDDSMYMPEEVERASSLPTLGIIPELKTVVAGGKRSSKGKKEFDNLGLIHAPASRMAEAYRSLRTSLLLSRAETPPKVILITSGLPDEGKSTISLNLSVSLAQQGGRVLLVDADLRNPTIHQMLRLQPQTGLSNILAKGEDFQQGVMAVENVPNLWIMAAGPRPPLPAELLGAKRMQEAIAAWRQNYDFVVMDTPPVLSVSDAVILSREADALVLVVRSAQTRKRSLLRTRETLLRAGAHITGVLVNRVDFDAPYYYHYYGYRAARYAQYHNSQETKDDA